MLFRSKIDNIYNFAIKNGALGGKLLGAGGGGFLLFYVPKNMQSKFFNAFKKISGNSGLVIIHDSARPSLNSNTIKKMSKSLGKNHGIILASKVRDTIKKTAVSDLINKTLKREKLWHSETPQIFKYSVLKKCYETDSDFSKYTDEAQLLENNGYRVKIFENNEYALYKLFIKEICLIFIDFFCNSKLFFSTSYVELISRLVRKSIIVLIFNLDTNISNSSSFISDGVAER